MATRGFRFLSYDKARCFGKGCDNKATCQRHTQIELDKEDTSERRVSYYETLMDKDNNECTMEIKNERK
jgi:hypothetical protein